MIQSTTRTLRGRGKKPGASYWCDHDFPISVSPTERGSYYARCLACLEIGPERESSKAAWQALLVLGASRNSSYKGVGA